MRAITRELAAFAVRSKFDDLPDIVRSEAARAFLNWMGCVFGGAREAAVDIAAAVALEAGAVPRASIIGRGERTDMASAAFVNCLSSSVLAFDDTHLATVTHPTGPVAAALFAFCEDHPIRGQDFVHALVLGMELECRLSNVLLLPPSRSNIGFYVTGLSGPIGTAVALGKLLNLDEQRMVWAIGLAAAQAAGFRVTHGTMASGFVPAQAARSGVSAALLAAKGFDCSDQVLEGPKGFLDVFSTGADLDRAADGLGERFETLSNAYKPYPCGIVIHPAIDACLEIAEQLPSDGKITQVRLKVHPLALTLTGRREPTTPLETQISLFHWAAAALRRRAAGLEEMQRTAIADPGIAGLRERIAADPEPALGRDEAIAEVMLADGGKFRSHVKNARGSLARPLTDDELDRKFISQVRSVLSPERTQDLLRRCRGIGEAADVGQDISSVWAG
jgi:2-methylcitrate dehydratase PrpD